jgi:hypothetical protein
VNAEIFRPVPSDTCSGQDRLAHKSIRDITIGNDSQFHCICGAYSTKADTDGKKMKNIKSHAQVCKTGYMLLKDAQSSAIKFEEKKEKDMYVLRAVGIDRPSRRVVYFGGVLSRTFKPSTNLI